MKTLPQEISFYTSYILYHYVALILLAVALLIGVVLYFVSTLPLPKIVQICGAGFIVFSLIPLLSPEVVFQKPSQNIAFRLSREGIICLDAKRTKHPEIGLIAWHEVQDKVLKQYRPYRGLLKLKLTVQKQAELPTEVILDIFMLAKHAGKDIDFWANEYLQASRQ